MKIAKNYSSYSCTIPGISMVIYDDNISDTLISIFVSFPLKEQDNTIIIVSLSVGSSGDEDAFKVVRKVILANKFGKINTVPGGLEHVKELFGCLQGGNRDSFRRQFEYDLRRIFLKSEIKDAEKIIGRPIKEDEIKASSKILAKILSMEDCLEVFFYHRKFYSTKTRSQ